MWYILKVRVNWLLFFALLFVWYVELVLNSCRELIFGDTCNPTYFYHYQVIATPKLGMKIFKTILGNKSSS